MTGEAGAARNRTGNRIFALIVLVAYLSLFAGQSRPFSTAELVLLLGLGALYAFIGTYGWEQAEQVGSMAVFGTYFGVQLVLGGLILYLSHFGGFISLLLLPLAGHSAVHLPRHGTWLVSALVVGVFIATLTPRANFGAAVRAGLTTYLAGVVFSVVFTQIAVRAERARGETERLAVELREANQKLRVYAAQVEELATTEERNRLAREIHDSLGHFLTVINMQLEAARAVFDVDRERALDAVGKAQTLTQEGLAEVRQSVSALRIGPTGGRPLPEAVTLLIEECRTAGILAELSVAGVPRQLPPPAELTLYRAAQEALTNVRKHAHASRVEVRLDYTGPTVVRLAVHDNGVGTTTMDGGFGLLGLRERVQLLHGAVRTESAAGQGFRLDVEVPA